jgi:hypothetical protein
MFWIVERQHHQAIQVRFCGMVYLKDPPYLKKKRITVFSRDVPDAPLCKLSSWVLGFAALNPTYVTGG